MMADQDQNMDAVPAGSGDDTKTRKTVKLKPSVLPPSALKLPPRSAAPVNPIADPLTGRDTDTGNLEVLDDTQTRRTVKLKPIAPQIAANQPIKLDTAGQGSVAPAAENTNTRKTVVLRPSVAPASVVSVEGGNTNTRKTVVLRPAAGTPAVSLDGGNTNTRKTVVLRPSVSSAADISVDSAEPAAPQEAPAAASEEAEDTQTRKTVTLRPSAVTPASVKLPGPPKLAPKTVIPKPAVAAEAVPTPAEPVTPPPAVEAAVAAAETAPETIELPPVDDDTQTRVNAKIRPSNLTAASVKIPGAAAAAEADEADDRTVRIARPPRKPAAPAVPASPAADAASRKTVVLPSEDEASRATMVLPETQDAAPVPPPPPVAPVKAATELPQEEVTGQTVELSADDLAGDTKSSIQLPEEEKLDRTVEMSPEQLAGQEEDAADEAVVDEKMVPPPVAPVAVVSRKGSPIYFAMALLTLLAISFSAAVTAIQYFNIWEKTNIEIPLLSKR